MLAFCVCMIFHLWQEFWGQGTGVRVGYYLYNRLERRWWRRWRWRCGEPHWACLSLFDNKGWRSYLQNLWTHPFFGPTLLQQRWTAAELPMVSLSFFLTCKRWRKWWLLCLRHCSSSTRCDRPFLFVTISSSPLWRRVQRWPRGRWRSHVFEQSCASGWIWGSCKHMQPKRWIKMNKENIMKLCQQPVAVNIPRIFWPINVW